MTKKPVHVAFVVGSLRIGGAERMMVHSANGLSAYMKVTFISLTGGDTLENELQDTVHLMNFNKKNTRSAIPALLQFLRKEKPDVLISTQIHVNLVAVIMKVFFRIKTKIVLREATTPGAQFTAFTGFKSGLVRTAVRILYPRADAIVAICDAVKNNLIDFHFARPSQVFVIYNPVLNDAFRKGVMENASHPFFQSLTPVFISVGRLAPAKNFELLIRAFDLLNKNMDSRLIIIGEGVEKDMLKSLITNLKLDDKVSLTGQLVNPYPYIKQSSAYVLTSLFEGLPNALIEAMACGIQLVSVNCPGGSAEVLMNGAAGRLIEADAEAIASAMRESIQNPVEKNILLESAKRFESEKTTAEYLKLLNTLVK
jgi:glycosyltransferase involved in cell wall biosynthesis